MIEVLVKSKLVLLIVLLFFISHIKAQVFKCISEDNKINYQATECPVENHTEQLDVLLYEMPRFDSLEEIETPPSQNKFDRDVKEVSRKELAAYDKKARKEKICNGLHKLYKKAQRNVIAKCKSKRDIFCSKSPEQIAQIYENKNFMGAGSRQNSRRFRSGVVRVKVKKSPLFEVKEALNKYQCK